jgi:uncharacterized protein (TIGR02453 family)
MAKKTPPFPPELFTFLKDLKRNNDRDWFKANKDRFERELRQPCLQFIGDFAVPLGRVTKHIVADPKPVGGSLFRIHRDTRFAKDKSPYKTHAGIHFRHAVGRDVHGPGYYLHLEPGSVFLGAGIWHPESATLGKIRDAIVAKPSAWKTAIGGAAFKRSCSLEGDSLKRPPRGYDPEHPYIDDLRRKDFIAVKNLDEKAVLTSGFPKTFETFCRNTAPFMRFLSKAVGLPF